MACPWPTIRLVRITGRHGEDGGSEMQTPQPVDRGDAISLDGAGDRTPWWVALIVGFGLTILGLVIFLLPGLTLALVLQFVGLFWLIDGIVGLACIFADRSDWGWKLMAGVLGVLGGLFVIQHPLWDNAFVPIVSNFIIGMIGILIGLVQLLLASRSGGLRTGISGGVSAVLGVLLAFMPTIGAAFLPFMLGGLALAGGVATMVASFKRRSA
jgi:uncharacterized membrane protein HdeD (DUF308 family)